jgi:hypothetical protein
MPQAGRRPDRACHPGGQWKQSSGSGCRESAKVAILGRGQGGRPGRRRGPGGTSRRRPGPPHVLPPAGSRRPAGAVISRPISPGTYGERGTAIAGGRLSSQADGDKRPLGHAEAPGGTSKSAEDCLAFPAAAVRERWRRPGGPKAFRIRFRTPGAARIIRPPRLLGSYRVGGSRPRPLRAAAAGGRPRASDEAVVTGGPHPLHTQTTRLRRR